jgi:hypothetical protein
MIKSAINSTHAFVDEIKTNSTAENRFYTDEELDKLLNVCGKIKEWLNGKLELQANTPPHVSPVLTTIEIDNKLNEIEREFLALVSKKPLRKPKVSTTTTDNASTTTTVDKQSESSQSSQSSTTGTEPDSQSTTTTTTESKQTEESTTSKESEPKKSHDEL